MKADHSWVPCSGASQQRPRLVESSSSPREDGGPIFSLLCGPHQWLLPQGWPCQTHGRVRSHLSQAQFCPCSRGNPPEAGIPRPPWNPATPVDKGPRHPGVGELEQTHRHRGSSPPAPASLPSVSSASLQIQGLGHKPGLHQGTSMNLGFGRWSATPRWKTYSALGRVGPTLAASQTAPQLTGDAS